MYDETVEKLKGFLKNKLSAEDHEQVCNMLAGDVEAEDTEPAPGDPDAEPQGKLASDAARADFNRRFPDASRTRIDNSEAGARRDWQVAQSAAELAQRRHWQSQSALDEMRKAVIDPSGVLADSFISSVASGAPCGTDVLERSGVAATARISAAENVGSGNRRTMSVRKCLARRKPWRCRRNRALRKPRVWLSRIRQRRCGLWTTSK
jgi:hypothetical protein